MNQTRHTTSVLIFLMMLGFTPLHAQNVPPPPRVSVETAPQQPVAGSLWTLTLIINHPYPNEVTVFPPEFAESLALEQTQIVARIVDSGGRLNRWTAAEYRFKLNAAETILFEPFTVVTPGGSTQTAPITLAVLRTDAPIVLPKPRLAWDGLAAGFHPGRAAAVDLVVSNWDPRFLLPPPQFFMPDLIDGAIIEAVELPERELSAVMEQETTNVEKVSSVALRVKIIPLKPGSIVFPARTVLDQDISFAIPQLRITVTPVPASPIATTAEEAPAFDALAGLPPFKEFTTPPPLKGFSRLRYKMANAFFRATYDEACRNLEELWDNGHYVESLALLRRREKHPVAGLLYTHLRRQAEQSLAVNLSGEEPPKKFFHAPWRSYKYGVLRETPFRRIPDFSGDSPGRFREGQPARISMMRKKQGNNGFEAWVWAETTDSSGWIPEARVIYF